MAIRGRKPKPTALKLLDGNPGHKPLPKNEPVVPDGELECPEWLEGEARAEWDRLAPSLIEMGVLTHVDTMAFAAYCQSYARWREAEEFLSEHGMTFETPNGYVQQRPEVSIAASSKRDAMKFCVEFGLTPSSRTRIIGGTLAPKPAEDEDEEMERLLGGG